MLRVTKISFRERKQVIRNNILFEIRLLLAYLSILYVCADFFHYNYTESIQIFPFIYVGNIYLAIVFKVEKPTTLLH